MLDLKPGMVVKCNNYWSTSRPYRYMIIEEITDKVKGYRRLRNGDEGSRAWGKVEVPLADVVEIVKGV